MHTSIDTAVVTSSESDDLPWRRRSRLWTYEAEIRRLQAEGYSLAQIIRRLGLGVSRPYLWRFLRRASAAAARPAGEAAPAALGAPGVAADSAEAAADDAAMEALLDASGFAPPTSPRK